MSRSKLIRLSDDCLERETPNYNPINFYPFHLYFAWHILILCEMTVKLVYAYSAVKPKVQPFSIKRVLLFPTVKDIHLELG